MRIHPLLPFGSYPLYSILCSLSFFLSPPARYVGELVDVADSLLQTRQNTSATREAARILHKADTQVSACAQICVCCPCSCPTDLQQLVGAVVHRAAPPLDLRLVRLPVHPQHLMWVGGRAEGGRVGCGGQHWEPVIRIPKPCTQPQIPNSKPKPQPLIPSPQALNTSP